MSYFNSKGGAVPQLILLATKHTAESLGLACGCRLGLGSTHVHRVPAPCSTGASQGRYPAASGLSWSQPRKSQFRETASILGSSSCRELQDAGTADTWTPTSGRPSSNPACAASPLSFLILGEVTCYFKAGVMFASCDLLGGLCSSLIGRSVPVRVLLCPPQTSVLFFKHAELTLPAPPSGRAACSHTGPFLPSGPSCSCLLMSPAGSLRHLPGSLRFLPISFPS